VVCDTDLWEQNAAQALEEIDGVICYAENQNLGFTIPYTIKGATKRCVPDFLVRLDDGRGRSDPVNLILEVWDKRDGKIGQMKQTMAETARTLWIPAINNSGEQGTWGVIEICDPWDLVDSVRMMVATRRREEHYEVQQ